MITYWAQVTKEVYPFLPPLTYKFVLSTHSVLYSGNKDEKIIQISLFSRTSQCVCACGGYVEADEKYNKQDNNIL